MLYGLKKCFSCSYWLLNSVTHNMNLVLSIIKTFFLSMYTTPLPEGIDASGPQRSSRVSFSLVLWTSSLCSLAFFVLDEGLMIPLLTTYKVTICLGIAKGNSASFGCHVILRCGWDVGSANGSFTSCMQYTTGTWERLMPMIYLSHFLVVSYTW